MQARFVRLAEQDRTPVVISIDGQQVEALEGDTLLTALMLHRGVVRFSEFGGDPRAGFCMMGSCQDCWVWTGEGDRLRACSTFALPDMDIRTRAPEGLWPIPA